MRMFLGRPEGIRRIVFLVSELKTVPVKGFCATRNAKRQVTMQSCSTHIAETTDKWFYNSTTQRIHAHTDRNLVLRPTSIALYASVLAQPLDLSDDNQKWVRSGLRFQTGTSSMWCIGVGSSHHGLKMGARLELQRCNVGSDNVKKAQKWQVVDQHKVDVVYYKDPLESSSCGGRSYFFLQNHKLGDSGRTFCLEAVSDGGVHLEVCSNDLSDERLRWSYNDVTKTIETFSDPNLVLGLIGNSASLYAKLEYQQYDSADTTQQWTYDSNTKQIKSVANSYFCVGIAGSANGFDAHERV